MDPNQQPQVPSTPDGAIPQPSKTNGLAIAGFVLAFLLPLFGLIFSIIGLVKAKDHNGNGKGLAIAGIIISVIMLILGTLLVLLAVVDIEHSAADDTAKNKVTSVNIPSQTTPQSGTSSLTLGGVYNEKAGTYSLKLPSGWTATQSEGSLDTDAIPSDSSSDYVSSIDISTDTLFPGDTLASFVSTELDTLKNYEGATIVSQDDMTINGASAHEITANENSGGTLSVDYEVILIKGNSVYYLKYETSPERGTQYLPVFKASAQSFVAH